MKHHYIDLREEIDLPNGVTLAISTVGEIVFIDADGKRTELNGTDNVRTFWYSVLGKFPESPRIPTDPAAQERQRKALADMEARKPHDFKVTVDPDGAVIMTLETGERVRLPSA